MLDILSPGSPGVVTTDLIEEYVYAGSKEGPKRIPKKTPPAEVTNTGVPNAPVSNPTQRFDQRPTTKGAGGTPLVDLDKPLINPDMDARKINPLAKTKLKAKSRATRARELSENIDSEQSKLPKDPNAVSYTHLTLPTILLV